MLTIVPTVDTEGMHGSNPFEQFILGKINGTDERWGVFRICDICSRHGVSATFFVDVYEANFWGEQVFRDLTRGLMDREFDVQLHTHPAWGDHARDFPELRKLKQQKSHFPQKLNYMHKLSLEQQIQFLRTGIDMLTQWTGVAPVAHRSGGYSINLDTIRALQFVGIALDSSMHHGHRNSIVAWTHNAVSQRDGILELPVTVLDYAFAIPGIGEIYRRRMKTDLNGCSLSELVGYVDQASARGVTLMNLFMHSYSLLSFDRNYARIAPNRSAAARLDKFLSLMRRRNDVRIMSCAEVLSRYREKPEEFTGPDDVPSMNAAGMVVRLGLRKAYGRINEAVRAAAGS